MAGALCPAAQAALAGTGLAAQGASAGRLEAFPLGGGRLSAAAAAATPGPLSSRSHGGREARNGAVRASSGGPGMSRQGGFQTPGGLILPGGMPNPNMGGGGNGGSYGSSSGGGSNAQPYLPFMRPQPAATPDQQLETEEILDILRERRGLWYDYAPYIGALSHRGWGPSAIAEATGIQGSEQSIMVVGAQVHSTLKELGCASLEYYDAGGAAEVLYEIRILSVGRRKDAAEYIAQQELDGKGAREVARSMKEHERRRREDGQDAFSIAPADCMAYAMYRQSGEVRGRSEKIAAMEKALEYAVTESAREKVREALAQLVSPKAGGSDEVQAVPKLPTVRLRMDETFPKPVLVLGRIQDLSEDVFKTKVGSVGVTRMEGPFEVFTPSPGCSWMAVPLWPALAKSTGVLAGVIIDDLTAVPSLKEKQIQGPLVLICEVGGTGTGGGSLSNVFLCSSGGRLDVTSKGEESTKLARVLVALLPPKEDDDSEEYDMD